MRSTGHAWSFKAWCSAVISCFFNSSDWCISILGGPLSHGSSVVVLFDREHPCFWNFYPTIPIAVVRVKSYVNCLFDPACVVMRVTINKFSLQWHWEKLICPSVANHANLNFISLKKLSRFFAIKLCCVKLYLTWERFSAFLQLVTLFLAS